MGGNNLDGLAVPGYGFALEISYDIQIVAAGCFCSGQQAVDLSRTSLLGRQVITYLVDRMAGLNAELRRQVVLYNHMRHDVQ